MEAENRLGSSKLNATSVKADTYAKSQRLCTDPKLRQPIKETLSNTAKIATQDPDCRQYRRNVQEWHRYDPEGDRTEDKAKDLEDDAGKVLDKLQNVFGFKKTSTPLLAGVSGTLDLCQRVSSRPHANRPELYRAP